MKTCKICSQEKPYNAAAKSGTKASGFSGTACWGCYVVNEARRAAAVRATPEGRAKRNATALAAIAKTLATPEGRARHNAVQATLRATLRATPEGRARHNAANAAWNKRYPEKAAALSMKRHAAKLQRVPPWADLDAIKQVYAEAQKQGLEVDHIYPLRGILVSGLHVANNLQLLTKSANSSKGNRFLEELQL